MQFVSFTHGYGRHVRRRLVDLPGTVGVARINSFEVKSSRIGCL
ncbi:MAG: hypothetical protein WAO81_10090 [Methanosarcina flavescens]